MSFNSFNIYNASAGSGKTFNLVKEYLKVLYGTNKKDAYKYILAITFTNKAVGELKERIIETLKVFANSSILESSNTMFKMICQELNIPQIEVHLKSKLLLNSIAHNYGSFDISTIDKFTQKLIRSFSHDLNLSMNFEVELDEDKLLTEAVDRLIGKAGVDKKLTSILLDYAFEKVNEDKSWDISQDFYIISKLLVNENDLPFIDGFKKKSLDNFEVLKLGVKEKLFASQKKIVETSKNALRLINGHGLDLSDFTGGYLPKYFKNLADKNFNINFDAKWQQNIESKTLYPKRIASKIASIIKTIQPQLAKSFKVTKQEVYRYKFLENFYGNITPLSVLHLINKELRTIKEEQNILLISEFNSIIGNQIKHQPAPYIYERIGEKYKHYFIDEFQDTSVMQWENLIPLLQNSMSGESSSTMLVGDAKQAIYRWRGGKAEQFIDLCDTVNPFFIEKTKHQLPFNFRSYKAIVNFNNSFFEHLSSFVFSKSEYQNLYGNSRQETRINQQGYVGLSFININEHEKRDEIYPKKVEETIKKCLKNGFSLKDICVLVRKKKEGFTIANYLSNIGIDIVSSETLLINASPEVVFINNLIKFILEPKNDLAKIGVLNYLADYKFKIEDKHSFYKLFVNLDISSFFKTLEGFNLFFRFKDVLQLPLYEAIETIIDGFKLIRTTNAHVQFYMDFVLDYYQKSQTGLAQFMDYYDTKKETLSIVSPQGKNAVQIMTIHKSKGLEFPVVIFPYADLNIYKEVNPKEWLPLNPDNYHGFTHALLNYNRDFENYNQTSANLYKNHQAELELDNINLLYVALTRAIEQLHIISNKQMNKNGEENLSLFSGMFINYLKHNKTWNDSTSYYEFGNPKKTSIEVEKTLEIEDLDCFISTPKKDLNIKVTTNSGCLWDTSQKKAIEKGNLIHNIMSHVKTKTDIDITLNNYLTSGFINPAQFKELKHTITNIVEHSQLSRYFNTENIIYNEKEILTKDGVSLRPDRLVINQNNEIVLLDYKTGNPESKHIVQINNYSSALQDMNFKVTKKILIYINDILEIKEV